MRKRNLLKLLLFVGLVLIICSVAASHFVKISEPVNRILKGTGVTFIVAYFLKASLIKTV